MKIIAVANQKGGVGKTTTSVNLAASLATMRRRVLLIDLDPQGNATMGSGVSKDELVESVYDVLVFDEPIIDIAHKNDDTGFFLLGSNSDLTAAEIELLDMDNRENRLKDALSGLESEFDYVFIDCPPSLNLLTLNALVAAQGVIIPMQCEYYALEGLTALMGTVARVKEQLNPNLRIEGIIRTMYDSRNSLTKDVSAQLSEYFGDRLYRTVVPRNVRLAEAPSYGLPVYYYDSRSSGSQAYLALAGEVLRRLEPTQVSSGDD
jgi:chromosome partitioning protein